MPLLPTEASRDSLRYQPAGHDAKASRSRGTLKADWDEGKDDRAWELGYELRVGAVAP